MSNIEKHELSLEKRIEGLIERVSLELNHIPEIAKINKEMEAMDQDADKMKIISDEDQSQAGDFISKLKARKKIITEKTEGPLVPMRELKNTVTGFRGEKLKALDNIIDKVSTKQNEYARAQYEIKEAARIKAEKAAEKETERLRKIKEQQAKDWESKNNPEKAQERREEAENIIVPVNEPDEVKTVYKTDNSKTSVKKVLKVEVIDLKALCYAISQGHMPITCINVSHVSTAVLKRHCEGMQIKKDCHGLKIQEVIQTAVR